MWYSWKNYIYGVTMPATLQGEVKVAGLIIWLNMAIWNILRKFQSRCYIFLYILLNPKFRWILNSNRENNNNNDLSSGR